LLDGLYSGSKIKVISVPQQNLNAQFLEQILWHALDGSEGTHGHKHRRLDFTMRCNEPPCTGLASVSLDFKLQGHCLRL